AALGGGTLADGAYSLSLTATDVYGNAAAPTTVSFTLLTARPPAPIVALDPGSDSGISNHDNVTNVTTPTINVTAQAGTLVQLYLDGQPAGQATANGPLSFN